MSAYTKPDDSSNEKSEQRAERLMEALQKWVETQPFVAYSPYETYSDPNNRIFLDRHGKPIHKNPDDPDDEAIWNVGKAAYELLKIKDREDFAERYKRFLGIVNQWRQFIKELVLEGRAVDQNGQQVDMELASLDERESSEILSMAWGIIEQTKAFGLEIIDELRAESMAFACLREVDNVIVGMGLDGRAAISSTVCAVNALADAQAYLNGSVDFRKARKEMAFQGAMARHRNDPKQAEKKLVFSCYQDWRAHSERYKSKAAFARDMLDKCEHLESQKKIEDWVRDWDNQVEKGTLPAG